MLGLRRTTVPCGTVLQTGEQIIIQFSHMQIPRRSEAPMLSLRTMIS
jgi:hypothetical protein